MRNIFIAILLFIGTVSAQTYHPVNLHVTDSIKVGMSTNSVWFTNMFVESLKMTTSGRPYTLDGNPQYLTQDSLSEFVVSAQDKDTFIVETAIGFDSEATNYQLRYLEGLSYPTITTGIQALSSADSNAFKSLKVFYQAPDDNTNIAARLFSEFGVTSVYNSDTTKIDSIGRDTTVYFVSSSIGDNANDGLSAGQAWETIHYAIANLTVGTDPVVVALRPGDTWAIDNVVEIDTGGTSEANRLFFDGNYYGWGVTDDDAIIAANSAGGNSPKYFDIVRIVSCDYVTLQNITVDGQLYDQRYGIVIGGSTTLQGPTQQDDERFITIQNCTIKRIGDMTSYQIAILAQTVNNDMYNINVNNCVIDSVAAQGITYYGFRFQVDRYPLHNGYVGYNTVTNVGLFTNAPNSIFMNNGVDSCIIEHNFVDNQNAESNGIALSSSAEDTVNVPRKIHIRYNDIRVATASALTIERGHDVSAYVYYNKFYTEGTGSVMSITDSDGLGGNVGYYGGEFEVYNNVMVGDAATGQVFNYAAQPSTGTVDLRNNIMVHTAPISGSGGLVIVANDTNAVTHTNNLMYRTKTPSSSDYFAYWGGLSWIDRTEVPAWEPTAIITDPTFVDFANFDWRIYNTSDAVGAGIDVGLSIDYAGSAVGDPPNMGAYDTEETP